MHTRSNHARWGWGFAALSLWASGCTETPATSQNPPTGASEFESAPPGGATNTGGDSVASASDAGTSASTTPRTDGTTTTRTVEETDIYRLDGDRLYYLNGYRGLMVFDVHDVDSPRLLGRMPLYGYPVEMVVRGGVAYAIMSDWYGLDSTGRAFHGSVVRAVDARDTDHLRVTSEIALGGWVRDSRVVGDVLYTISDDWGGYGYYDDEITPPSYRGRVVVNSVDFSTPGALVRAGERSFDGYSGIFNVTADAILMAHTIDTTSGGTTPQSAIDYVDISDPHGAIRLRGSATVDGSIQGWGANNGRFNIDYDGRYVRALSQRYDGGSGAQYILHTLDARDPDHLVATSRFEVPGTSWIPAARFDHGRMYLSPSGYWTPTETGLPIRIYDVSDAAAPRLAGETSITGNVWSFIPAGDRLFAIGNEYNPHPSPGGLYYDSSRIAVRYLDVSDAAHPRVIGSSTFGEGWAWTPAADNFKAFTMDATRNLVVLPFSGWNPTGRAYQNGLQLIEFNHDAMSTAGVAHTRGWTERGIFVNNRLVALSDLSLSVIDYRDHATPRVVRELTLARNVVTAHPLGDTMVQVSSDWWGNDSHSTVRVVPTSDPDDATLAPALSELEIEGNAAQVFHNGNLAYVATTVPRDVPCAGGGRAPDGTVPTCTAPQRRVTVVDVSNPRAARVRSVIDLPMPASTYGYGWYGGWWYGWYGWWDGQAIVQVAPDLIAVRDEIGGYYPYADAPGGGGTGDTRARPQLHLINLADADHPTRASMDVTGPASWWGNVRVSNGTLFVTHYDWIDRVPGHPRVRYFLDRVDVSDRAHPRIAERVNVPGFFVGASADARTIYTVNYAWESTTVDGSETYRARNTFNALRVAGGRAYLQGSTTVDGWMGQVFVQGERAYFSTENNSFTDGIYRSRIQMHALDLHDASAPVDRASADTRGWGWLLGVAGDRAVVSSGWGTGVNVYRLADGRAPELVDFVRTHGWWGSNLDRQGDTMFLCSGYYGVQTIPVGH